MSYQVLARKWRPRSFQQMVGQEHILRMLINALDNQRLHHAYLFTGTRGVGKTSLARIFSKCLNCETGITSTPCDQCQTCQAIDAGKFLDLIEVDAASRTKVEDTRELLDNVQYTPTQGRFKIYLIDEVHMLSSHSFNALLKTLEEPPAYVKFLLATTDPKRLPITILSRCLQFNLKRVPIEKMSQQLAHICTMEKIIFEEKALPLLAHAADGSMRDALSLLDQTIAYCADQITQNETQQMLGSVEQDAIYRLLGHLANQDGTQLLNEISALAEHAPNFSQILEDLLAAFHQINVAQLVPDRLEQSAAITELAKLFNPEEVQLYYQIALVGRRDLPLASNPHQGFEMVMLRMLAFHPDAPTSVTPATPKLEQAKTAEVIKTTTVVSNNWGEILPQLNLSGMAHVIASNCTLDKISSDKVELTLSQAHATMLNDKLSDRIELALSTYLNKPIKLSIKIATTEIQTPAKQLQQKQTAAQVNATEAIQNDGQVKKIMDIFGATLDESSIKAI